MVSGKILALLVPAVLALVLAAPCLTLGYVSDDFAFLQRAQSFRLEQLLPDPRSAFYRPISRELYFGLLALVGPATPMVGHILNAALLAALLWLTAGFAIRLTNRRTGYLSAALLASVGPLPFLVAWISCSQELLTALFVLVALHLELGGRRILALSAFAAALLSKETALFFLPALASLRFVLGAPVEELKRGAARYLTVAVGWALVHRKIQSLVAGGGVTGEGGYVGLDNPTVLRNLVSTAATAINFPLTGFATPWPGYLTGVAVLAVAVLAAGNRAEVPRAGEVEPLRFQPHRVATVGVLLGVVPGLLTALVAKHWFPYYWCLPAIGVSLLGGLALARLDRNLAFVLMGAFLLLGIWYRGSDTGRESRPAERNLRATSARLERLESGLKRLHPTLPDSALLYVSIHAPERRGLRAHLLDLQAPRVWYRNATLLALEPDQVQVSRRPRFLFWVTRDGDVFEVDGATLEARSSGPEPNPTDYQKAVRAFAMGTYRAGNAYQAVAMLLRMHEPDAPTRAFDRRLAAMLLIGSGREPLAARVLGDLPPLSRTEAIDAVAAVVSGIPRSGDLDDPAFRAFGLPVDDPEIYRGLMSYFSDQTLLPQAFRMANRLLSLRPGDEDAKAMIAAIRAYPKWEQAVIPVEGRHGSAESDWRDGAR